MKKIIILFSCLFCLKGFSQSSILLTNNSTSATLAPNAVITVTTTPSSNTQVVFDIKNTSASQKSYNAKRYDVVLNSGATAYFCFAGSCYGDQTFVSPTPIVLNANQSASQIQGQYNMLMADLDEGTLVGYSLVKYTFVNAANSNDSIQVSIKYNAVLGLTDLINRTSINSFDLFPNPATTATSIKVNSKGAVEAKLSVYNALGAMISEKPVSIIDGKNKLDLLLTDFNSGVYFIQLKTNTNIITKRLIVN